MQKNADAFRTISEVAEELSLPQHVLRFWETRFPQIRPLKRAGGRRYYRPGDITLLKSIRALLYEEGYTIKGVQRLLKEQGARNVSASATMDPGHAPEMLPDDLGEMQEDLGDEATQGLTPAQASVPAPETDERLWTRARPEPGFEPVSAAPDNMSFEHAARGLSATEAAHGLLGPLQRDALETVLLVVEDCERILAPLRRRTA